MVTVIVQGKVGLVTTTAPFAPKYVREEIVPLVLLVALYVTATSLLVLTVFVPKLQAVGVVLPESFLLQEATMAKRNTKTNNLKLLFFIITMALWLPKLLKRIKSSTLTPDQIIFPVYFHANI